MTLLTEPTRIVLAKGWDLSGFDADAAAYIQRVEWADTTPLEAATRTAINSFDVGCKADGIWTAIKASCILSGARTLSGALTPLVGTAPTPFGFVDANYDRKTGLVGDGSTKYLDSNRASNADPQNNHHVSVYQTVANTLARFYIGARTLSPINTTQINSTGAGSWAIQVRNNGPNQFTGLVAGAQFAGGSRSDSSQETRRNNSTNTVFLNSSLTPPALNYFVFACNQDGSPVTFADTGRLAFYSIGESLDLALLDARVTDLINAFAAAIP